MKATPELLKEFKERLIVLCVICREGQGVIRMPSGNYMCLECYEGEMILSNQNKGEAMKLSPELLEEFKERLIEFYSD